MKDEIESITGRRRVRSSSREEGSRSYKALSAFSLSSLDGDAAKVSKSDFRDILDDQEKAKE